VSTREQTDASEKLADTLKEISDLAHQVALGSEESRKAIEDISQIALKLNDILWSTDSEI
jgi:methyl-accepting chemotaxis protein